MESSRSWCLFVAYTSQKREQESEGLLIEMLYKGKDGSQRKRELKHEIKEKETERKGKTPINYHHM